MKPLETIVRVRGLNKFFGEIRAVNDLSFEVRKGELFAFLGVNGAGKSTTISVLSGQLRRDGGETEVCGADPDGDFSAARARIGVVFQNSVLDGALSVRENLESRAALYGICGKEFRARLEELSGLLSFRDLLSRTVKKLSGGQRRRIDAARALLHRPELLFLDEPTTGLDPQTRRLLWSVLSRLRREQGITVFLTTHYMEEAADADYVVIIDGGKKAAEGTPLELKNKYTGDYITLYGATEEELARLGLPFEPTRDGARIAVPDTSAATRLIVKHPAVFRDFEIVKGKMDDVFLAVTGKKPGEESA